MKHNIRINGEVQEFDCELGSTKFDKNGREIFEGDKVKFGNLRPSIVYFYCGTFYAFGRINIAGFDDCELEIVDD